MPQISTFQGSTAVEPSASIEFPFMFLVTAESATSLECSAIRFRNGTAKIFANLCSNKRSNTEENLLSTSILPRSEGQRETATPSKIDVVEIALGFNEPGSSLNLRFPFTKIDKGGAFSLAVPYERRWPPKREVSFEENDDCTLKAVTFGTNPRDWVDAKFIFKVNKFFGPFIGYQYGSQPPSFKLVDHQMKIGFLISVKQK